MLHFRRYDPMTLSGPWWASRIAAAGRILIHLCLVDSSALIHWTSTFPEERMSSLCWLLPCFIEIPVLNANIVDTAQTPHSAASELCLHCLPMFLKGGIDAIPRKITFLSLLIRDTLKGKNLPLVEEYFFSLLSVAPIFERLQITER